MIEDLAPPLKVVVTAAGEGAACDAIECEEPAVVNVAMASSAPFLRCATCWALLEEMLRRRGHRIIDDHL